jgi:hypothetical protein
MSETKRGGDEGLADFMCGYILHFKDGREAEETILQRKATLSACERIGQVCLGVTYSGSRPLDRAEFVIAKESQ